MTEKSKFVTVVQVAGLNDLSYPSTVLRSTLFVAICSTRAAFGWASLYSTEIMPRPLPRAVPSPPEPFLTKPSISGERIALGVVRSALLALMRTVLLMIQQDVNTKFE